MSDMNSLCLTCLSDAVNGVAVSSVITEFLRNVLCFGFTPKEGLPNRVCLLCYKTLFEIKRFLGQLQDVEHYFKQTVAAATSRQRRKQKTKNTKTVTDILLRAKGYKINARDNEIHVEREVDGFYHCDQCHRIFEETRGYKKHLRWHKNHGVTHAISAQEKKYPCEACGKSFRSGSERSAHKVVHTNLRPYKCTQCPKTFRQPSGLSVHKQVHSGKRVLCHICCKRFSTTHELNGHLKVHNKITNKTLHRCNVCAQTFFRLEKLRAHNRQCDRCDKVFCSEEALKTHQEFAHLMENDKAILLNADRSERLDSRSNDFVQNEDDNSIIEDDTETILG